MENILRTLYELAIDPFASPEGDLLPGSFSSSAGHFETCDVCFDPGYDPLDPPPPEEPDPSVVPIG